MSTLLSEINLNDLCDFAIEDGEPQSLPNPRTFILAGKATFTVVSHKTGVRFTFKVTSKDVDSGKTLHFVSVLTGSDNTSDYTFLGTIFDRATFRHGSRSKISTSAASAQAFAWMWNRLAAGAGLTGATIHHEGRCGRCNRALTVPTSILSGFGPECSGKMGM